MRLAVAALVLRERQFAAASVLLAEPDNVRASLTRVEQQREREPRLRSYRMTFLELLHLLRCPRMEAF